MFGFAGREGGQGDGMTNHPGLFEAFLGRLLAYQYNCSPRLFRHEVPPHSRVPECQEA